MHSLLILSCWWCAGNNCIKPKKVSNQCTLVSWFIFVNNAFHCCFVRFTVSSSGSFLRVKSEPDEATAKRLVYQNKSAYQCAVILLFLALYMNSYLIPCQNQVFSFLYIGLLVTCEVFSAVNIEWNCVFVLSRNVDEKHCRELKL